MSLDWIPYDQLPYLSVLAVLVLASFGLPIPEDIPLLTGGYLCYKGLAHGPFMVAVGLVGVLTGDVVLFSVGRLMGHRVVNHRYFKRMVKPERLLLAEKLFADHGIKIIFAGRFLPVLRPMIFMAAGVLKVRLPVFLLVNGLAACLSVPTLIFLGWYFGHNLDRLQSEVRQASHLLALVVIVLSIAAVGYYIHRRQRRIMSKEAIDPGAAEDLLSDMPAEQDSESDNIKSRRGAKTM